MVLSVACSLLIGSPAAAQTLDELLAAVATYHPVMASSKRTIRAAEESVESARGRYWPSISTVLEAGSNKEVAAPSRRIALEQTLWDAGATGARVEAASAAVELAKRRMDRKEHELQLQVIDSWRAAHSSLGRHAVARRAADRLKAHEEMMERRVKADVSPSVDLELIRSQLLQEQIQIQKSQVSFALAVQRLEQLTGKQGLAQSLPKQPAIEPPQASESQMLDMLRGSWSGVASQQPLVLEADAEVVQGERQLEAKRSDRWPQVYGRIDRAFGGTSKTVAFIGVRHTLDMGGVRSSELAGLEAQVSALLANKDAAVLEVQEQIQSGLSELEDSFRRFDSVKQAAASYLRIHNSYIRQFIAGRKTWLDVMNAMREVSQNEYAMNEALHEYAGHLARLKLFKARARQ